MYWGITSLLVGTVLLSDSDCAVGDTLGHVQSLGAAPGKTENEKWGERDL